MFGKKDGSVATVVAVIVVLVVIAGVAVYFTSDKYRTKMDAAYNQYAHWTPENIAKDPESYLNFCETQANKALFDLKASEISIAQSRGTLQNRRETAKNEVGVGEKSLAELKELYSKAEAANGWPVDWQGQKRDKDTVKRQIVSLSKQVEGRISLIAKIDDGMKKLDIQVTRVQDARAKTQEQIAEIKIGREMLKVQKITNDLTDRLVSIKAVLQATISTASETTGTISLEQLAAESATVVDDKEFDKIMGGSGAAAKPADAPKPAEPAKP